MEGMEGMGGFKVEERMGGKRKRDRRIEGRVVDERNHNHKLIPYCYDC